MVSLLATTGRSICFLPGLRASRSSRGERKRCGSNSFAGELFAVGEERDGEDEGGGGALRSEGSGLLSGSGDENEESHSGNEEEGEAAVVVEVRLGFAEKIENEGADIQQGQHCDRDEPEDLHRVLRGPEKLRGETSSPRALPERSQKCARVIEAGGMTA